MKLCPAVKADAYGHGVMIISKMLEIENLVDYLAVASMDEGIELREVAIKLPILILGLIMPSEAVTAIKNDLTITVCEKRLIDSTNEVAKKFDKIAKVHLKVDTGMERIGCKPEEALELVKYINEKENLFLEGIFSHFSKSEDNDKEYTYYQLNLFKNVLDELNRSNINVPIKHIANSGAIVYFPETYFDIVRLGIIIYGYFPPPESNESIKVTPSLSLRSEINFIKRVEKGSQLSYGDNYVTKKESYIATIPAGYADGVPRALTNNYVVKIKGKYYPIAGNICMDQIMVDLGDDFH